MNQFTKEEIVALAERIAGLSLEPDWTGCGAVFGLLERMREEGAVVLIKLDGERVGGSAHPYTLMVSGGPLGDDFFRLDCKSIDEGLCYIIGNYSEVAWPSG